MTDNELPRTKKAIAEKHWKPICNILMYMHDELTSQDEDKNWQEVISKFNNDSPCEISDGKSYSLDIKLIPDTSYINENTIWVRREKGVRYLHSDKMSILEENENAFEHGLMKSKGTI